MRVDIIRTNSDYKDVGMVRPLTLAIMKYIVINTYKENVVISRLRKCDNPTGCQGNIVILLVIEGF